MKIQNVNVEFKPFSITVESYSEAHAIMCGFNDAGLTEEAQSILDLINAPTGGCDLCNNSAGPAPTAPVQQMVAAVPAPGPVTPTAAVASQFSVGQEVKCVRADGNGLLRVGASYLVSEVLPVGASVQRRSGVHTLVKPAIKLAQTGAVTYRDAIAWDSDRFVAVEAAPAAAPAAEPSLRVGDHVECVRSDGNGLLALGDVYTVTEVLPVGATVQRRSGPHVLTKPGVRLDPSEVTYRDAIVWDADRFIAVG